jgi:sulfide:quinone oxidoreductase
MSSNNEKKPTILIVGASFGGLGCARRLMETGATTKFHVILVERKTTFTIGGLWQFVWTNRLQLSDVEFPLGNANLAGIDVRLGNMIKRWNVVEKHIVMDDDSILPYDYIVMACGIVPDPTPIPGIERHVNICSFDTVARQQAEAQDLIHRAKTSPQTFVLAIGDVPYKCPPAPFELTFMLDEMLTKAQVRDNVKMTVTCPIDWPMPHPNSQSMFTKEMASRNIHYLPLYEMEKVENDTVYYKNGKTLEASLLWTVYPIRAPDFVQDASIEKNEKGTISIHDSMTNAIPSTENAFAIGDCCCVEFENNVTIPKAGEFAWKMGVSVAEILSMDGDDNEALPVDRLGACVAEIGFGNGIELQSDFSNAINKKGGEPPEFRVSESTRGEEEKVNWVNSYLHQIFGDKVAPLNMSSKQNRGESSTKRQRVD